MNRTMNHVLCGLAIGVAIAAWHDHREHERWSQAAACAQALIPLLDMEGADRCFTDRGLTPPWDEDRGQK